jgi:hypothetical protein
VNAAEDVQLMDPNGLPPETAKALGFKTEKK